MNKSLRKVFEIYVFAYAFLFASRPLSDPDFWFHLKTGQYLFQHHGIPRTELFSFTNFGRPWVAHGWLSGAIFYAIYSRLGLSALVFLFALLTTLAFWIAFKRSNSHVFIGGFCALLGVWTVLTTIGVRPRVFTLLFASIYLALLNRYAQRGKGIYAIWWLVPLMTLWANLHGGFLIGLALIILTIVGLILDGLGKQDMRALLRRARTLIMVLIACSVAVLANPFGLRLYTFPISVLMSPVFQSAIVDWVSPNFHEPELFPLALLILLTITALVLSPKRPKPSELLFFLATFYSTLRTQRNLSILALVAVPILADHLHSWLTSTRFGRIFDKPAAQGSNYRALGLSLLLLLPLGMFASKLKSTVYVFPKQQVLDAPLNAVTYLKENEIWGNTFTYPNIWGAYVLWALQLNPVYIDGRDVYPEEFVKEYLGMVSGSADWREPFERYGVRIVIVKPKAILAREIGESPDWQQIFSDDFAVVFRRR
ncbi:MAG TPA: hypothetical protein VIV66_10050 [Pyrinomonadaceae bacterium]